MVVPVEINPLVPIKGQNRPIEFGSYRFRLRPERNADFDQGQTSRFPFQLVEDTVFETGRWWHSVNSPSDGTCASISPLYQACSISYNTPRARLEIGINTKAYGKFREARSRTPASEVGTMMLE
jgi:hypothetical protein